MPVRLGSRRAVGSAALPEPTKTTVWPLTKIDRRSRVDGNPRRGRPAGHRGPVRQVVGVHVASTITDHDRRAAVEVGHDRRGLGDGLAGIGSSTSQVCTAPRFAGVSAPADGAPTAMANVGHRPSSSATTKTHPTDKAPRHEARAVDRATRRHRPVESRVMPESERHEALALRVARSSGSPSLVCGLKWPSAYGK